MDKITLIEELKDDFNSLSYKNKEELDRLERRLKMIISKVFGSNSDYLEDLNNIHFFPLYFYTDMPESRIVEAWNTGKNKTTNLLNTIIEELKYFPEDSEASVVSQKQKSCDSSKIFIVHGHDDGAKNEVARFVEKLGLEAVILHEQVNSGDTIIEKLEKHTDVGFAIVLYTSCDIGGLKTEPDKLKPRARQNVVFEHGLLIGKIGRANVIALVKEEVEIPNDVSGVVYETMDSKGAWKFQLAREIKASGYDIDMNKVS